MTMALIVTIDTQRNQVAHYGKPASRQRHDVVSLETYCRRTPDALVSIPRDYSLRYLAPYLPRRGRSLGFKDRGCACVVIADDTGDARLAAPHEGLKHLADT